VSDQKKRLTAAELLQQQQEREAEAQRAQTAEKEADNRRRAQAEQARIDVVAEKIRTTWYDQAVAAATRTGVRFVVLAQVIDGHRIPVVADLMNAMRADGYTPELVSNLASIDERGRALQQALTPDDAEREVMIASTRGWKPAALPKLGQSGTLQYLIAKWA